jgi:putative oxidoreductase
LQRLFSTFPNHWPGFGLLLMRLGLGIMEIYLATAIFMGEAPSATYVAQSLIAATAAVFLLVGFWTPVTAIFAALDQIWITQSLRSSHGGGTGIHILLAVLSASVAMLGPGAWSIDARLFGRRRFPVHRTGGDGRRPKG